MGLTELKEKVTKWMNSNPGVLILQIVAIGLSLFSIGSVVSTFNALSARGADVTGTINNWESQPVVDVTVASASQQCPIGYSVFDLPRWPGAIGSDCGCPVGATYSQRSYSSSSSSCSTNQTKAGCLNDRDLPSYVLSYWRAPGYNLCYKRGGTAAAFWSGNTYNPRPTPDIMGACPSGFKRCGIGPTSGATCAPVTDKCPITSLKVMTSAVFAGVSGQYSTSIPLGNSSYVIAVGRGNVSGQLPLVDVKGMLLDAPTRGNCIQGRQQIWSRMGSSGSNYYAAPCTVPDPRYYTVDSQIESTILTDLFDVKQCNSKPNQQNVVPPSIFKCGSSDSICQRVISPTCTKLKRYANQNTNWGLYVRNQIGWSLNCSADMNQVRNANVPLTDLINKQEILMIVNIFSNLILGLLVPGLVLYNRFSKRHDIPCIPGDGKQEAATLNAMSGVVSFLFRAGKIAFVIFTIILSNQVRGFFQTVAANLCSDTITNETFVFLATATQDTYWGNIRTAVIDILQMLFAIASWTYTVAVEYKSSKMAEEDNFPVAAGVVEAEI